MRFHEFHEDKGSTLASRTISRYADEIGPDSMDYKMFKKTAELLDAGKLRSLAQHIYYSDTSPAEYVMKVISKKDPETFEKMYGDQEGYFSLMKPRKDLTDSEVQEGAEMIAYHKHPTQQNLWTFPKAFEDQSPVPAKEFIARTTQWLQKNIGKRSPEEPATRDGNMISGGKPEGYMNQMVKAHNEIARKVLTKYPEVTHFGFN